MSTNQEKQIENVKQVIHLVEPDFNKLAKIHGAVNFQREASFALQALKANDFLAKTAVADQDSLKNAILNVAAIGLSLSPVTKQAYLVPRKGKICLDISYRGYIKLGVEVGSIKWAVAEIVYSGDMFRLLGLGKEPLHEFNPFDRNRGEMVGAYCVAKTHDGDYLVSHMSIADIYSIRDRSEAWIAFTEKKIKSTPWHSDETEMIKKTVIRRAYKSWPDTDTRAERLDKAIDITAEVDPIDFSAQAITANPKEALPSPKLAKIQDLLFKIDRTEDVYVAHLETIYRRKIKELTDLTDSEMDQSIVALETLDKNRQKKIEAEAEKLKQAQEVNHENAG